MKKGVILRAFLASLFFALFITMGSTVHAKDKLSRGDVFCTEKFKFKVLKEATIQYSDDEYFPLTAGEVQLMGFNPSFGTPQSGITVDDLVESEETKEKFCVVSIKKNAFKGNTTIEDVTLESRGSSCYQPTFVIESGSFANCPKLKGFTFTASGGTVNEIGLGSSEEPCYCKLEIKKNAFKGCKQFEYFGYAAAANSGSDAINGKIKIKKGAFKGCKNVNVVFAYDFGTLWKSSKYDLTKAHKAVGKLIKKSGVKKVYYTRCNVKKKI